MNKTLIFTVALNGYQWHFRSLFASHQAYAERHGYDYVCVTQPTMCTLGMEVAWLKIQLILNAMRKGYKVILFVDADTRISEQAPALESVLVPGKTVYAAKGFSGRINSGVLLVQSGSASEAFFERVLDAALQPLPDEDCVGWGENGHIIHFAKHFPFCGVLDGRWNNNRNPREDDFIRHYSHGPMFQEFHAPLNDRCLAKITHLALAALKRLNALRDTLSLNPRQQSSQFYRSLSDLSKEVSHTYDQHFALSNTGEPFYDRALWVR